MYIEKLERNPSGPVVTVRMNYDEVIHLVNAMYHYTNNADKNDEKHFQKLKETFAEMSFVKDVVKHGMLQEDTVQHFREAGYHDVLE